MPVQLTAATVFGAGRSESGDSTQAILHVRYTPANSGEKITLTVEVMEAGGVVATAGDFGSMVTSSIAAGVTTLSRETFEFVSTAAGENRIAIPIPIAFRALRGGVKDSVGTTGKAWVQGELVE